MGQKNRFYSCQTVQLIKEKKAGDTFDVNELKSKRQWCNVNESAQSVPAPYRSIITHSDENTAVPAETRLSDGRRAFGKSERGTPEAENIIKQRSAHMPVTSSRYILGFMRIFHFQVPNIQLSDLISQSQHLQRVKTKLRYSLCTNMS